jgi:hypothetical protein
MRSLVFAMVGAVALWGVSTASAQNSMLTREQARAQCPSDMPLWPELLALFTIVGLSNTNEIGVHQAGSSVGSWLRELDETQELMSFGVKSTSGTFHIFPFKDGSEDYVNVIQVEGVCIVWIIVVKRSQYDATVVASQQPDVANDQIEGLDGTSID